MEKFSRNNYYWIIPAYSAIAIFIGLKFFSDDKSSGIAYTDVSISLIGFIIAFVEIFRVESVSKKIQASAVKAANEMKGMLRKYRNISTVSSLQPLVSSIKDGIIDCDYPKTIVRLEMLHKYLFEVHNTENITINVLLISDKLRLMGGAELSDIQIKGMVETLSNIERELLLINNKLIDNK